MAIAASWRAVGHGRRWRFPRWMPALWLAAQTRQEASATSVAPAHVIGLESFEAFFHDNERAIFGYLWRMTGEEQAAYDLCQETFLRAWQRYDAVRAYERPGAWLLRVATNLALNYLQRRRSSVRAVGTLDDVMNPAISDPAWRLAERDAIRVVLLELPARQRAALVLREVYGLSCAEVAQALGTTVAAAKMTLTRAREEFRTRYGREGGGR